jgi:hypothetical protein
MAITPVSLFSDEWTTLNSIQSANSASSENVQIKKRPARRVQRSIRF